MSINNSKSSFRPPDSYIVLDKPSSSNIREQYIRINNNSISILDPTGKIIQQTFTNDAKQFPLNLSNEQICHRSMLNNVDEFVKGFNYSAFYVGGSGSGKERLFDGVSSGGDRQHQHSLVYYFVDYLLPELLKKYRKVEVRMKMVVVIKEKVYDCLSDNRYSIVKVENDAWDGIRLSNATNVIVEGSEDFLNELKRGTKQKNKLILEYKELYTSYLTMQFIHESYDSSTRSGDNQKLFVVSRINIFEIPSVEILSDSHSTAKIKESSSAVKSLLNFTSVLGEYAKNPDFIPYYQNSILTQLTKEVLSSNSLINVFFTFRIDNIQSSLATLKFIKPFTSLRQYPVVNESYSLGLLKKFRSELFKRNNGANEDGEKNYLENEIVRLQTEEDYQRIMEKYTQMKQKYNQALKAKSEAQLELIKCEEEKLEIGKSLVQVQIENTKLLEKLQNKDYESGKKMLSVENKLAEKQMSHQEMLQKIQELTESLNEALETKRDLEVEFIALKRNFIMNKKELDKLKEDNQNLSLDVINITNLNEKLKKELQLMSNNGSSLENNRNRSSIIQEMEREKFDELKRENKNQEQTITYLKSEVERFKKELIENQTNFNMKGRGSNVSSGAKNYDRIELESENMELMNRLKLRQRKIDEIEEKLAFFEDENEMLENENRRLKIKDHNDTQEYRKKLEGLSKNANSDGVIRELKENFMRKDTENLDKINSLTRDLQEKKRENAQLKGYIRELIVLLEEWSPKGAEIPEIRKYTNLSLGDGSDVDSSSAEALKIKNRRLQEEIRRLKQALNMGASSANLHQSRVIQQYNFLKESSVNNGAIEKLRNEKNNLIQENRKLANLLRDGNKMDLNILTRENNQLKQEIEYLKNSTSISPSTGGGGHDQNVQQKIGFYEKHIKKLEKERSQLLSRCVVAQEQVKNMLGKMSGGGRQEPVKRY